MASITELAAMALAKQQQALPLMDVPAYASGQVADDNFNYALAQPAPEPINPPSTAGSVNTRDLSLGGGAAGGAANMGDSQGGGFSGSSSLSGTADSYGKQAMGLAGQAVQAAGMAIPDQATMDLDNEVLQTGIQQNAQEFDTLLSMQQQRAEMERAQQEQAILKREEGLLTARQEVRDAEKEIKWQFASPQTLGERKRMEGQMAVLDKKIAMAQNAPQMNAQGETLDMAAQRQKLIDLRDSGEISDEDFNNANKALNTPTSDVSALQQQKGMLQAKYDQMQAEAADPANIKSDTFSSFGNKILAALAAGMVGYGAGLQGRSDSSILDMINKTIDRDINLKLKRGEVKNSILGTKKEALGDLTKDFNLQKSVMQEQAAKILELSAKRMENKQSATQALMGAQQLYKQSENSRNQSIQAFASTKMQAANVAQNVGQFASSQAAGQAAAGAKQREQMSTFDTRLGVTDPDTWAAVKGNGEMVKQYQAQADKLEMASMQADLAKLMESGDQQVISNIKAFFGANSDRERQAIGAQLFAMGRRLSASGAALHGSEEDSIRQWVGQLKGFAGLFNSASDMRTRAQANVQNALRGMSHFGLAPKNPQLFNADYGIGTAKK
jgi:hypothetical protein